MGWALTPGPVAIRDTALPFPLSRPWAELLSVPLGAHGRPCVSAPVWGPHDMGVIMGHLLSAIPASREPCGGTQSMPPAA